MLDRWRCLSPLKFSFFQEKRKEEDLDKAAFPAQHLPTCHVIPTFLFRRSLVSGRLSTYLAAYFGLLNHFPSGPAFAHRSAFTVPPSLYNSFSPILFWVD